MIDRQRGHYGGVLGSREEERLQQLEEEQEQLNNSLMALTSHFAQVCFVCPVQSLIQLAV